MRTLAIAISRSKGGTSFWARRHHSKNQAKAKKAAGVKQQQAFQ
jgi:hypothetical protein